MAMARDKSGAMPRSVWSHISFVFRGPWRVIVRHTLTWPLTGGWWEAAVGDGVFVYQQRRQRQSVCDGRMRRPVSPTGVGFVSICDRECREGPVWLVMKKMDARVRTHFHYRSWFLMRRVATLRANLTKRSSIVRYPPSLTLSASLSSDFLSANHMYFKRFLHCSIVKMCSL